MSKQKLSIVIPAYNEENRLQGTLEEIFRKVGASFPFLEVIVVDDGSSDHTLAVVRDFGDSLNLPGAVCRAIRVPGNRGKGNAVRTGMLEASGELALMSDADLSTPIEELGRLVRIMEEEDADMVIGSRGLPGSEVRIHQPWYREYGGKTFNLFVRVITSLPFRDTQCGFKLFRTSTCRRIFKKQLIDRFAFDVELLFIAVNSGLKVVEEPVVWRHSEGSKVNMLSDSFWTFCELVRIRLNNFRGKY